MVTSDFSAFSFSSNPTQLCFRAGGQNFSCNMTATEPTKPYLALRAGGKNVYAPLVTPSNDSFPLRIRIGNNTLAPQSSAGGGTSTGNVGTLTTTAENMLSTHETMCLGTIYREVQAQNGATLTVGKNESGDFDHDLHPGWDFEVGDEIVLHHSKKKGNATNSYAGRYEIRKILSVTESEDEDDWGYPLKIITLDAAPNLDLTNYYVQAALVLVVKNFVVLSLGAFNQAYSFFSGDGIFEQTYSGAINWSTVESTTETFTIHNYDVEYYQTIGDTLYSQVKCADDTQWEALQEGDDPPSENYSEGVTAFYAEVDGVRRKIFYSGDSSNFQVQPYYGDGNAGENGGLLPLKVTGKLIYVNSTIATNEYTIPLGDGLLIWANEVLTF